jgi:hypothetical protein
MVAAAPALWRSEKTVSLSGHTRHEQVPSPVSAVFVPPDVKPQFTFRPHALAAAMARTSTLRDAPDALLERMARSHLVEIECLVEDGVTFRLSPHHAALADAERAAFAGRVGAGMTDLVMNTLGYVWRDNAACLSTLDPHADFIYAGGAVTDHGVVLAEAHGSFAQSVDQNRISGEARRKYLRQVRPHIAKMCPHGKVIHGYSVAFGCNPANFGTFMHVSETRITQVGGPPSSPPAPSPRAPGTVATSHALPAHRANFLLMGASQVVAWIDWLRGIGGRPADDLLTPFFAVEVSGRRYFVAAEYFFPFLRPWFLLDEFDWPPVPLLDRMRRRIESVWENVFAMDERAAKSFLFALSQMIGVGRDQIPPTLDLPVVETAGLFSGPDGFRAEEERYPVAQFRDGLALLGRLSPSRSIERRSWSPQHGFN